MSDKSLKLQIVFDALDKMTNPIKNIFGATQKAQRALAGLKIESRANKNEMRELTRQFDELKLAGRSVDSVSARMEVLQNKTNETNASIQRQQQIIGRQRTLNNVGGAAVSAGTQATAAGVALAAPIGFATKDAMKFESAMADVRKVTEFSDGAFVDFSDDLLALSTRVPIAVDGLAQIAAAGGADGVGAIAAQRGDFKAAREELIRFVEAAANMGVAYDITPEEAGLNMSAWRTGMKLSQDQAISLGDTINSLSDSAGGGFAKDIAQIVTRMGPLADIANVTSSELAAMGSVLSGARVEPEIAATSIKNMTLALTKSDRATKAQSEAYHKLGLSSVDVAKNMRENASGTIMDVLNRLKGLNEVDRIPIMDALFGSESIAGIGVLANNTDLLQDKFKLVGDNAAFAGSMHQEFLRRIATSEGATGLANNALKSLNIQIGTILLPYVIKAAEKIAQLANKFKDWTEKHPKLSKFLVTFVAVLAGLLLIIGPILVALGMMAMAMGALGITTLAAALPVLGIIAVILILIGLGILLYQNWGRLPDWAKKIFTGIKDTIIGLFTFDPAKFFSAGMMIIDGLVGGIKAGYDKLRGAITGATSIVSNAPKQDLDMHSPSRLFVRYGQFISDGWAIGITRNMDKPLLAARNIARGISGIGSQTQSPNANNNYSRGSSGGNNHTFNFNITGSNPSEIATAVRLEIERIKGREKSRALASLGDF